jgi:hypothetical protein
LIFPTLRSLRCPIIAAFAVLPVTLPAHATPFVVGVHARVTWPALGALYGETVLAGAERDTEHALVAELRMRDSLRYWTFAPAAPHQPVLLRFSIVERQPNEIKLLVDELVNGRSPTPAWAVEIPWLKPADLNLRGYPGPRLVAQEIAAALAAFLSTQDEAFRQQIQKTAPLAVGGNWRTNHRSPFEIVLPLSWDFYKPLRKSEFRLSCTWPERGVDNVDLRSFATGESGSYVEDGARYSALVVIPRRRTYAGTEEDVGKVAQEVIQLRPHLVYLAAEVTALDIQVFQSTEDSR